MQSRPRSIVPLEVQWLACAAVLIWSIGNWLKMIILMTRVWTAAPLLDYWRIVADIPRYEGFDLTVLWEQQNEHRIIFPELAMAADAMFLRGRGLLPVAFDFGFQFLTLAVYAAVVWKYLDGKLRFFVIALGCGLMGWPGIGLFYAHPFLVQWLFLQAGVVMALTALPRSTGAAIACGVIANYSAANGLFIWPILIVAAIVLRLGKRQIGILTIAGAVFTGLYFAGYHPGPNLRFELFFQHPVFAAKWAAAYLSLPFGFASTDTGLQFGFAGMLLLAALLALSFRRREPASVVFLGAALFVMLSAIVATAGRMRTDHAVPSVEFDIRFVSLPLWFWLSLLFASAVAISSWTKWNWCLVVPVAVFLALRLSATSNWIEARMPEYEKNQLAGLALESGVIDLQLHSDTLYYDPEYIERTIDILRRRKLSVFASGRYERLGKSTSSVFPGGQGGASTGETISTSFVESGLELRGSSTEGVGDIVIANQDGIIVGLGGRQGSGWVGFANLEMPAKILRVFYVDGNKLEAMGSPIQVPDAIPLRHSQMGQFLSGLKWEETGGFGKGRYATELGFLPYGTIYGNWSKTGGGGRGSVISAPFETPPGNCIVIPAGHGAPVTGESIDVVDAEKGVRFATLPIGITDPWWRFWRVDIPAGVRTLRIEVKDQGTGAAAWVGVAQPARCTSSYQ